MTLQVSGPRKHKDYFEALVLDGETIVATCRSPYRDTCDANARLIAAAPEMLEALQDTARLLSYYHKAALPENREHLDVCENPDNCHHCGVALGIRAAIAKATGAEGNAGCDRCGTFDREVGKLCSACASESPA